MNQRVHPTHAEGEGHRFAPARPTLAFTPRTQRVRVDNVMSAKSAPVHPTHAEGEGILKTLTEHVHPTYAGVEGDMFTPYVQGVRNLQIYELLAPVAHVW